MTLDDIDLLAVTQGPGLIGSLIIGISYLQGISYRYGIPMVGVNHIEGHLTAPLLGNEEVEYPVLGLIVSGGHTMLIKMDAVGSYTLLGRTLDDAAGEAFDKVAMMMGLGYPGGPLVSKLAQNGDPHAIKFPRGLIRSQSFDFSFSGLKTAVLYCLKSETHPIPEPRQADIAASFEEAVADVLVKKTINAAKKYSIRTITAGGGVIRNARLRHRLEKQAHRHGYKLVLPDPILCTDNAGYDRYTCLLLQRPSRSCQRRRHRSHPCIETGYLRKKAVCIFLISYSCDFLYKLRISRTD